MSKDNLGPTLSGESVPARAGTLRGWIGALAVAAVACGLVVYKELGTSPGSPASTASMGRETSEPSRGGVGSVLLIADPTEAGSSCGCGEIIRLVRAAATRGVTVREVAAGSDPALERAYRVRVAPSVLLLDPDGHEVARHEGEDHGTIDSIRAALDRLAETGR